RRRRRGRGRDVSPPADPHPTPDNIRPLRPPRPGPRSPADESLAMTLAAKHASLASDHDRTAKWTAGELTEIRKLLADLAQSQERMESALLGEVLPALARLPAIAERVDSIDARVGHWPEPVDAEEVVRRMQTQSVQDMTHEQVIAREERVRRELSEQREGT